MALDHRYPSPLFEGTLLRRYKRFLADVIVPAVSDAQTIPGGPQAGPSGVGPSTAGSAQAARALQPTRDQRPKVAPKTWPELRDRDSRLDPTRRRRAGRGRRLLLLMILVVAAASSAAFLILNWPF